MSDLLNRIESLLEKASMLGGTKDFDCEQELRDASNTIFELEQQVNALESGRDYLSGEYEILQKKNDELEQQLAQERGKNIKLENDIQRMIHNHYHAPITPPGAE